MQEASRPQPDLLNTEKTPQYNLPQSDALQMSKVDQIMKEAQGGRREISKEVSSHVVPWESKSLRYRESISYFKKTKKMSGSVKKKHRNS